MSQSSPTYVPYAEHKKALAELDRQRIALEALTIEIERLIKEKTNVAAEGETLCKVGETELERLRIEVANLRKEKTPGYELLAGEIGRLENELATTIERCAQVAKAAAAKALEDHQRCKDSKDAAVDHYLWCHDEAVAIEAAIRALKDTKE